MPIIVAALSVLDLVLIVALPVLFAFKTPRNRHPAKIFYVLAIGLLLAGVFATVIFHNDFISIGLLTGIYALVSQMFFCRGRIPLFYQVVYITLLFIIQLMAVTIGGFLIQNFYFLGAYWIQTLIFIIKFALETVYTLLIIQVVRVRSMSDVSKRQLSGLFLIPIFSLFSMMTMLITGSGFYNRYGYGILILHIALTLGVNFYCLYLYYDISRNQEMKRELAFARRQNEIVYKYYAAMEQRIQNSRKVIHDMRNHIYAIQQLYESGDVQKGSQYAKDMGELLDRLGLKSYTSNRMLNMILNDKLFRAASMGIEERIFIDGMNIDFIRDMDITTIFSNLLDNAIDAAKETEHGFIEIKSACFNDMLTIYIKNPVKDVSGDRLLPEPGTSTKPGHEGLGLSNVVRAMESYHGELSVSQKKGIFCASLLFPLSNA
ncbi:MAG TPA: GHKL domain-containing protein [Candidatus Scybalocola faecavium]|nr:GHKL domain-containing protein [Candidatus Scybalocola faecavium]